MTTILAVDGNSLAHRAFHALPPDERGASWLTGAILNMLASAWDTGPYDGILVALDGGDNGRKLLFDGYKANRQDTDPLLREALAGLEASLTDCGISVDRRTGIEADDLLAAAADACTARGWQCAVLSSDRDMMALVSDSVRLLRPRQSMSDLKCYGPADVVEEFGVEPWQYTDFAALRGDKSDGLTGANGIGPKTAARLLRDYGDIPSIYAALTSLPARIEHALRNGRENVERNLMLMAPIPRLHVDIESVAVRGVSTDRIAAVLTPAGLGAIARRFQAAMERPPLPPMPPPPLDPMTDPTTSPTTEGPTFDPRTDEALPFPGTPTTQRPSADDPLPTPGSPLQDAGIQHALF